MYSQDKTNEKWAEPGKSVYVPDDLYHSFQNIFEMMKEAQRELHKVRDEMKPIES
jgi:hypothetical protein